MLIQRPTFSRILFLHGFFHVLGISIPILVIAALVTRPLFELSNFSKLIWFDVLILFIGSLILIWISIKRYRKVIFLIGQSDETKGKVIEKYGGYVVYEYKHHGQIHRASENLAWPLSKKLKLGQELTVLVNHQSPRQALFYDLYQ